MFVCVVVMVLGVIVIVFFVVDVFSKYLGEGEKIFCSTFIKARKSASAVFFFDEIDGMCGFCGDGVLDGVYDVVICLFLVFLMEMDGLEIVFFIAGGVFVMATTNRSKSFDFVFMCLGRFDLVFEIFLFDFIGCVEVLCVYICDVMFDDDVDFDVLVRVVVGYTGVEFRYVVKEVAFVVF